MSANGSRKGKSSRTRGTTAEMKVARQRLSVMELAEVLGNVSAAGRQRGITRTQSD